MSAPRNHSTPSRDEHRKAHSRNGQKRYGEDDNNYGRQGSSDFPVSTRHGARRYSGRQGHPGHGGRGKHIHELSQDDDEGQRRNRPEYSNGNLGNEWRPDSYAPYNGSDINRHPQPYTDHRNEAYMDSRSYQDDWANEDYYYNQYDPDGSQEGYFGTEGRVSQHTINPYGHDAYNAPRDYWDDEDADRQVGYTAEGRRASPYNSDKQRTNRYNDQEPLYRGRRINPGPSGRR